VPAQVSEPKIEAGSLVPASAEPKDSEVKQDRQCGRRLDNESAQAFADAIRCELGKDLMRAVKHSSNDRIPKPSCHETKSSL